MNTPEKMNSSAKSYTLGSLSDSLFPSIAKTEKKSLTRQSLLEKRHELSLSLRKSKLEESLYQKRLKMIQKSELDKDDVDIPQSIRTYYLSLSNKFSVLILFLQRKFNLSDFIQVTSVDEIIIKNKLVLFALIQFRLIIDKDKDQNELLDQKNKEHLDEFLYILFDLLANYEKDYFVYYQIIYILINLVYDSCYVANVVISNTNLLKLLGNIYDAEVNNDIYPTVLWLFANLLAYTDGKDFETLSNIICNDSSKKFFRNLHQYLKLINKNFDNKNNQENNCLKSYNITNTLRLIDILINKSTENLNYAQDLSFIYDEIAELFLKISNCFLNNSFFVFQERDCILLINRLLNILYNIVKTCEEYLKYLSIFYEQNFANTLINLHLYLYKYFTSPQNEKEIEEKTTSYELIINFSFKLLAILQNLDLEYHYLNRLSPIKFEIYMNNNLLSIADSFFDIMLSAVNNNSALGQTALVGLLFFYSTYFSDLVEEKRNYACKVLNKIKEKSVFFNKDSLLEVYYLLFNIIVQFDLELNKLIIDLFYKNSISFFLEDKFMNCRDLALIVIKVIYVGMKFMKAKKQISSLCTEMINYIQYYGLLDHLDKLIVDYSEKYENNEDFFSLIEKFKIMIE